MKYLVKDPSGKTVLATVNKKNAIERLHQHPEYKLVTVPEER